MTTERPRLASSSLATAPTQRASSVGLGRGQRRQAAPAPVAPPGAELGDQGLRQRDDVRAAHAQPVIGHVAGDGRARLGHVEPVHVGPGLARWRANCRDRRTCSGPSVRKSASSATMTLAAARLWRGSSGRPKARLAPSTAPSAATEE